jgi:hypothetical protein
MKTIAAKAFVITGILTFSLSCFGQNNDSLVKSKNVRSVNQSKNVSDHTELKTDNRSEIQTVSNGERRPVLTSQEKIEALQSHIQAIDIKVDHVNSDDDLKNRAIQDNWFDKMQAIREELVTELNELKSE